MGRPTVSRPREEVRSVAARRRSFHLLALAMVVFAAVPLGAQEDTTLVEAVVRIDIVNGPAAVVPALSYNSTLLLPLRQFLELSEVRLGEFVPGGAATAFLEPGNLPVRFNPDSGRLVRGDTVILLEARDAVWSGDELYVAITVIDRAFGVSIRMEWADLSAVVGHSVNLPVVRRARRSRRHALLRRAPRERPAPLAAQPSQGVADGAVLEWSLRSSTTDPASSLTGDIGAGAKLFGGSLALRANLQRLDGTGDTELRTSWERAWPEQPWIRQVRLGDVLTSGRRARLVQGLVVTNAPFIRSSEFDIEDVIGRLPAGWEVEMYDRGRLTGFDEVDPLGTFRVPLQLRYGANPFELVLYGPAGEVVRQRRTVRVPFSRLPSGRFEYAVAGGRCRFEPCRGLVTTDVRYGITNRITLQGGADYFWADSARRIWQPYAALSAAPTGAFHATGEAVLNGHLRGAVGVEPSPDLRLDLSYTMFDQEGRAVSRGSFERHRTEGALFWRPPIARRLLFFQALGTHSTGPESKFNTQRISVTYRPGRVQYTLGFRHDFVERSGLAPLNTTGADMAVQAIVSGPFAWLRGTSARASTSLDFTGGLAALRATIGRQIARLVRVDVGLSWLRVGGYGLELNFNTLLPGPRLGTRNRFSTDGGAQGLMFLDGSVIVDPNSRVVHLSDGRDLGRAGLAGVVFLDENGNGARDPGERGLEGVPVRVGGWLEETDFAGRFAAWDLFPFEASYIEIDSLAFDDPRFVLPNPTIRVNPTPNSFLSVDVPVVIGAEVSGFVVLGETPLAGVPVVIRDLGTGHLIGLLTFTDGGFYRVGVPPGEYEVTVPPSLLDELGATVTPLHISIPPGPAAGETPIEDLVLRLATPGAPQ